MSLLNEDNNQGVITREEVMQFFNECKEAIGSTCEMKIDKCGGSFYNDGCGEICFDEKSLDIGKWSVKELVIHELAHHEYHISNPKTLEHNHKNCRHSRGFYRIYTQLLERFMC